MRYHSSYPSPSNFDYATIATVDEGRAMTITTHPPMTLEEYLTYDDGTDTRYELVDGLLVEMPTESTENTQIAMFLISVFLQMGIPYYQLGIKQQIAVHSDQATARDPDLIVHSENSARAISGLKQALLQFDMPPPTLAVEIVSNSDTDKKSRDRDYLEKRSEYATRRIPEYWIIDPIQQVILVLTLSDGSYQEQAFTGGDAIVSPTFPELHLSAEQVLSAGL
jgi:Uma2 family endonuclease